MEAVSTGNWPVIIAAVIVGILSVARTARLLTHDTFPPAEDFREWFQRRLPVAWEDLAECPFCMAPYLMVGMIGWAWLSDLHWTWWVLNGWWAASYLAAMVVAYDQPE